MLGDMKGAKPKGFTTPFNSHDSSRSLGIINARRKAVEIIFEFLVLWFFEVQVERGVKVGTTFKLQVILLMEEIQHHLGCI